MTVNAWGEPVDETEPSLVHLVPPADRKDTDDHPADDAWLSDPDDPESGDGDV